MALELVNKLPYDHPYRWDGTLFGGPKLWRPDELGASLALWLDAEDTASITLNGSTVSQWDDKSGNSRHFSQATAANQPTYQAAGFNGRPTLNFDGGSDFMTMSNVLQIGNSSAVSYSVFVAFQQTSVSVNPRFVFRGGAGGGGSINTDYGFFSEQNGASGDTGPSYRFGTGAATDAVAWQRIASPIASNNPVIFGGVMNASTGTTGTKQSYFNGTLAASGSYAVKGPAAIEASIGAQVNSGTPSTFMPVAMSEMVMFRSDLSTTDRQKLEGYLAWKWCLEANLPAGHPYKSTPPTV